MNESLIELANSKVSILTVLSWYDIYVPEIQPGRSWKARCVFGETDHLDYGLSKTMRVYSDTNSAYCFDGCGYLSPVSLYAKKTEMPQSEAAEEMLKKINFRFKTREDLWFEAVNEELVINKINLGKALQEFCMNEFGDSWKMLQLNKPYSTVLDQCLKLLNSVKSEEDVKLWLSSTKTIMRKLL